MIASIIATLRELGSDPTADDIADAIWLARYLPKGADEQVPLREPEGAPQPVQAAQGPIAPPEPAAPPPAPAQDISSLPEPPVAPGEPQNQPHALAPAGMYPRSDLAGPPNGAAQRGLPFGAPQAKALPYALEIGRSIRPLRRRVLSRRTFVLDERATAERIAEQQLWLPVTQPARARWLDVALVFDETPSMALWRQTATELMALLAHNGAFRDVRMWWLNQRPANQGECLFGEPNLRGQGRVPHGINELIDATGRRLILVLSDCVAPSWYDGRYARVLEQWGRRCPVTIVQMLPRELWSRTALGRETPIRVHSTSPGLPNTLLDYRAQRTFLTRQKATPVGLPVPVVTLERRSLAVWARMIAGAGDAWSPGLLLDTRRRQVPPPRGIPVEQMTATQRVQRFRADASPLAYDLAELMAAVPVRLPVVRMIQETLLPQSLQTHVAEVFLSGLLQQVTPAEQIGEPDETEYEFYRDGMSVPESERRDVRQLLLESAPIDQSMRVLQALTDFVITNRDRSRSVRALIGGAGPDGVPISPGKHPFAQVTAAVLHTIGYGELAQALEQSLASASHAARGRVQSRPEGQAAIPQNEPTAPVSDALKTEFINRLPPELHGEAAYLAEQVARLDDSQLTSDQLLNLLVADNRIAHLLGQITSSQQTVADNKLGSDAISGDTVGGDKIGGDTIHINFNDISDPKLLIQLIRDLSDKPASDSKPAALISDELRTVVINSFPPESHSEAVHLVEQTARYDNGRMTSEELLNLLVADKRIADLLRQITSSQQPVAGNKLGSDAISGDTIGGDTVGGDKIDINISDTFDPKSLIELIRNLNDKPDSGKKSDIDVNISDTFDPKSLIELIRNLSDKPGSVRESDTVVDQYQKQFSAALGRLNAPKYQLPLTIRTTSAQGESRATDAGIPLEGLIARIQTSRLTLLHGGAGSGRSTCMRRLAEILVDDQHANIVPIFLQLRQLRYETLARAGEAVLDDADAEQYIEPLLDASIVPLGTADLKLLGEHALSLNNGLILIMADGLNELYGEEVTNLILKRLIAYVTRRGLGARVLVSDRITPRDSIDTKWKHLRLELLAPAVVLQQFQAHGMESAYQELSVAERTLLQTPYFLAYALDHNTTRLSSAAEAIKAFFEEQGFNGETLDRMAQAAFNAYSDDRNYKFDASRFMHAVGDDVYRKLVDEGILFVLADEGEPRVTQRSNEPQAQFDHPLKHDYLAARYLAQHSTEWTPASFDAASFESNSFDALAMTLELLQDANQCDTFIQRVYNWNSAAALVCIAKAVRTGSGRHSQEIQFAVLALEAEKLFDPVQQTRMRASAVLALFPQAIAAPYQQVRDLGELYALVQQQTQSEATYRDREPWFPKWRDLFVRFSSPMFSEQDRRQIVSQEGLIGWTAANVFRRFKLSDLDILQLRAYYDAASSSDNNDWRSSTIRSRVVHALGRTDTQPAVELLFEALTQDRYVWARTGAARSLIQLAALTADSALRRQIVDMLIDMVKRATPETLAIKLLHEIGQSVFYRGAHPEWQEVITPLIVLIRDRQTDPERDWWSTLLVEFEKFCQAQANPSTEAVR